MISMSYDCKKSSWKTCRWKRVTWYFHWEIYTSVPAWTHRLQSLGAEEAPSLKRSLKNSLIEHLSNDHKDHPNQHNKSQKLHNETRDPFFSGTESQMDGNWYNHMIRISQWRESHCITNTCVTRKNKSKREGLWESKPGIPLS